MDTDNLPESDSAPSFSVVDYLLKTTLWAYFIPVIVPLFLTGLFFFIVDFFRVWNFGKLCIAICLISNLSFIPIYFCRWLQRFKNDVRQGLIPENETLRLLPFWIPLFHYLLTVSIFYFDVHFENLLLETIMAIHSLFFLEWQAIVEGSRWLLGKHWAILFAPIPHCLVMFAVAIAGTFYVTKNAPLPPPSKGLRRMMYITFFLCIITFLCFCLGPYNHLPF